MRPEIWPYSARTAARQVEAGQGLPIIAGASDLPAAARLREVGDNQAEQFGIDINLVGFAVSLGCISLGRISVGRISIGAAARALGEPDF